MMIADTDMPRHRTGRIDAGSTETRLTPRETR
ncbi:hypothetical protein L602_000200001400 [Cupriavidus gilardii J11]|uniref:Uncharacterized protein n=1 Tax=Cupriavidus gilardii J11 TaxID=936133 RepID=A0A562BP60_9BURK|nr:hypothetical protein L602_000200001400 [Cupriavidus gilardii J11]